MIIVKDKRTNKNYILLGTGFGAYKAVRPSLLGGNFIPHEEEGTVETVAVCDKFGDISWHESSDLQVIKVDGIEIRDINIDDEPDEKVYEYCPACGATLSKGDKICHDCGITIMDY
ncbi:hypothetical protein SH1V18_44310 [Vallitalea longa]|uniref:Zinc-ribbon domain-containing protein n=1 Tax=Vallitalea longa TaxID=2936439 RepID=A0A9W6DG56_9FIRM|nr:hypothetical protein [Vallitalea longa]GKX31951.1 hypothetical protein SH1V18_44310 [Vallitalea longa]